MEPLPLVVENQTGLIHSRFTQPTITIAPEAISQQQSLILGLAAVGAITTPEKLNDATAAGVAAQRFVKDVEAARLATTKPLREFTDEVNKLAKSLSEPVQVEQARVGKQVALYRQQEEDRVKREEAERQKAIQAADEASKLAAAAQAKAEAGMSTEADLKVALEAERTAREKEEAYRLTVTTTPPEVTRSKGSAVRKEIRFEVVDIHEVYKTRPELVTLDLNRAACRAILNKSSIVPGLRITEENVGGFRVR